LAVHSGRSQVIRLLQLILALQANRYPNARRLAELCGVSRRTIYRDMETLEAAGIPVQYRPELQGYQLSPSFVFHPPELDEQEAQALLVLAHLGRGDDGLGLRRQARSAAWKAINGLTGEARARVLALAEMVHDQDLELMLSPERKAVYDGVLKALTIRRQLRLWVLDSKAAELNSTKVSPYRLLLDGPIWHLIGRSTLHRGVHAFRLPRVRRVELTDDTYEIPPRFSLERFLGEARAEERGPKQVEIVLRFARVLTPELGEHVWHRSQRVTLLDDGRLELQLWLSGIEEVLGWILSFGDQVEVVSPAELRTQVRAQALRVAQIHLSGADALPAERLAVSATSDAPRPVLLPTWLRD
jgi:predicted DNA-binding transcriptional regulator YafY